MSREGTLLFAYAIVDAVPESLGLGHGGAPLRAVEEGGLAAIVSEHERAPEAGEDELWAHEAMVERLMEEATVLPLRFGTTVADEGELRTRLRERGAEFASRLEEVRGAVELSVRAELPVPEVDPVAAGASGAAPGETGGSRGGAGATPGGTDGAAPDGVAMSGTEYMRERARSLHAVEGMRGRLHEPLRQLGRRAVLFPAGARPERFRGAYLVDAGRVEAFAELVEVLAREMELEVSCTGPWPPFSFVAEEGR